MISFRKKISFQLSTISCEFTLWRNEFTLTKNISSSQCIKISLVKSNFHDIFATNRYLIVWKLRKFIAIILLQKFRETIFLLKNFTLNCFDEKNAWQ